MNETGPPTLSPPAFSPRIVLGLVLFGAGVFVLLLWMIGSGMTTGDTNNGGGHAGGRGINGYAALADYLERRGLAVSRVRNEGGLYQRGVLILTPPPEADAKKLAEIVDARRQIGATIIVVPKWNVARANPSQAGVKRGWVHLAGPAPVNWSGFYDDLTLSLEQMRAGGQAAEWVARDESGALPVAEHVLSGRGKRLVPLAMGRKDGRILAAWINDGGIYPDLEDLSLESPGSYGENDEIYPVVFVFEADLLNNYGMADAANARLAEALVRAAVTDTGAESVIFDLTLNGLGRSANLLSLAFTPPYLAATLCLLLAALAVGWRAFLRFGPGEQAGHAIAFGKRALVANAAGLLRRARRPHLIAPPYAAHARERIARALALPCLPDAAATDAAIDRALAARDGNAAPFSAAATRLDGTRRETDMLRAARALHAIERKLTT